MWESGKFYELLLRNCHIIISCYDVHLLIGLIFTSCMLLKAILENDSVGFARFCHVLSHLEKETNDLKISKETIHEDRHKDFLSYQVIFVSLWSLHLFTQDMLWSMQKWPQNEKVSGFIILKDAGDPFIKIVLCQTSKTFNNEEQL